jgi:glycine dehydrogenase subunit 1
MKTTHPYIPNSTPKAKEEMLHELGMTFTEELYSAIPKELRLKRKLHLPAPILSEGELRKHVNQILAKNTSAGDAISFLGSGCYQHYVPAVCDEVNSRNEFLTAYSGRAYEDHGRYQALFEYQSLMAELLNAGIVNLPTYDGDQAAATAVRMAAKITGRKKVLVSRALHPNKLSKILEYDSHLLDIQLIDFDSRTGEMDLRALKSSVTQDTAAVYFDNPNFFGVIETRGAEIADAAHKHGALLIVGAEPLSLGILKPPADYGADITCGDIQSLGMHTQFGGGHGGYIATRDEEKFIAEYPNRIVGILPTTVAGEYGFGEIAFERTSFMVREQGKEWVGTMANLWAITAGVYLALMGPQGMVEVGEAIQSRVEYAIESLSKIKGIKIKFPASTHFREFLVDFSNSKKSITQINKALLKRGIFGGYDTGRHFPEFKNHAVYCFTEVHSKENIDKLVAALKEVLA